MDMVFRLWIFGLLLFVLWVVVFCLLDSFCCSLYVLYSVPYFISMFFVAEGSLILSFPLVLFYLFLSNAISFDFVNKLQKKKDKNYLS